MMSGISRFGAMLIAVFALALVWGGILLSLRVERAATLELAARDAANFAGAFEDGVLRSVTALDQSLLSLRRSYARNPGGFDIQDWSEVTQALSEMTVQFAVTDRQGMLVSGTVTAPRARMDLSVLTFRCCATAQTTSCSSARR
jgi:hypothetical protein